MLIYKKLNMNPLDSKRNLYTRNHIEDIFTYQPNNQKIKPETFFEF